MLSTRGKIVLFLIGMGLLGVYIGVKAQDRPAWPPRPVIPPDEVVVPYTAPSAPPRTAPSSRVAS